MTARYHDSEHTIQNAIRNALVDECHLFRANVGVGWQGVGKAFKTPHPITVNMGPGDVLLRQARPFDTGLPPGFADTFGWREITITPDMVGQRVAVFIALEIKSRTGRERDAQIAFVNAVKNSGGRAGFARSTDDALDIVRGTMHASRFSRERVRMERRGHGKRALERMARRERASLIIEGTRIIGYRMRDGSVACFKSRYKSEDEARAVMSRIRAESPLAHVPVRTYQCPWCRGYHMTSRQS